MTKPGNTYTNGTANFMGMSYTTKPGCPRVWLHERTWENVYELLLRGGARSSCSDGTNSVRPSVGKRARLHEQLGLIGEHNLNDDAREGSNKMQLLVVCGVTPCTRTFSRRCPHAPEVCDEVVAPASTVTATRMPDACHEHPSAICISTLHLTRL